MDELVKQIAQRANISEEQARQAAEVAIGFIKERLPEPLRGQVDGFLGSSGGEGGLPGGLGKLFG